MPHTYLIKPDAKPCADLPEDPDGAAYQLLALRGRRRSLMVSALADNGGYERTRIESEVDWLGARIDCLKRVLDRAA